MRIWRLLNEMEAVTFILGDKKYRGTVLGCEKEYFWLLVSELKRVYVGHPDRVFELEGTKHFEVFDHCQDTDKMFDTSGTAKSYLFDYSRNPDRIIGHLTTLRSVGEA